MSLTLKLIVPTLIMLLIVYGLLLRGPEHTRVFSLGGVAVSLLGLERSLVIAARLFVISATTVAFVKATPLMQLADGLRSLGIPAAIAAVVVSSCNLHASVGLRMRQIVDAQRSRGLSPRGSPLARLRMYAPVLRPLLFAMVLGAVERSALWHDRGYLRAHLSQRLRLGRHDVAALLIALLVIVGAGCLRWLV
jgi:energy-coupling factor transporter transmembrane protein EcfT